MELKDRARHIDVQKLSKEETENLAAQLGNKIRDMVDNCINEVNKLLSVYGLEAKMQCAFVEMDKVPAQVPENIEKKPEKAKKSPRKRRSKKAANL
jgi:hypothetical protein